MFEDGEEHDAHREKNEDGGDVATFLTSFDGVVDHARRDDDTKHPNDGWEFAAYPDQTAESRYSDEG